MLGWLQAWEEQLGEGPVEDWGPSFRGAGVSGEGEDVDRERGAPTKCSLRGEDLEAARLLRVQWS